MAQSTEVFSPHLLLLITARMKGIFFTFCRLISEIYGAWVYTLGEKIQMSLLILSV